MVVDGFYLGRVAPGGKLSDMLRLGSRAELVWSGRVAPGGKLSDIVLIGSRVKLVWSGCGGGRWYCFSRSGQYQCRERALTVPRDHLPFAEMFRRIRTAPLFAQFFRLTKNPLVRQHPIASPGEKLSWKLPKAISMTEEECGRQCSGFVYVKTYACV